MKKSAIYKVAQMAVLNDNSIPNNEKLEVLSVLMKEERLAQWCDEQENEEGCDAQ